MVRPTPAKQGDIMHLGTPATHEYADTYGQLMTTMTIEDLNFNGHGMLDHATSDLDFGFDADLLSAGTRRVQFADDQGNTYGSEAGAARATTRGRTVIRVGA